MFDEIVIVAEPQWAAALSRPPTSQRGEPMVITRQPELIKLCQLLRPAGQSMGQAQTGDLASHGWRYAFAVVVGTDMATSPWWQRLSPRVNVLVVDLGHGTPPPDAWANARTEWVTDAVALLPTYLTHQQPR